MHPLILKAPRALVGTRLEVERSVEIAIADGLITDLHAPASGGDVVVLDDLTLLPGFIDAHVHIGFYDPEAVLEGGVTTVRDLGWPGAEIFALAERSRAPGFPGPLVVAAGQMLTVADGYPTRAAWAPPGTARVVTSHEDARSAVEEQVRRGAVAVKVALNAEVGPTLDRGTLEIVCDTTHAAGLAVTAHVFGETELSKAIAAGVDELAHVPLHPEPVDDRHLDAMVERGMRMIPTLAILSGDALSAGIESLARFARAGGRIVYGTDLGNEGPEPGIDRKEIEGLAAAGLDGRSIVEAATVAAASCLRLPRKGVLAAGSEADIIGVRGDPVARPTDMCDVAFVMRAGRVVRAP